MRKRGVDAQKGDQQALGVLVAATGWESIGGGALPLKAREECWGLAK